MISPRVFALALLGIATVATTTIIQDPLDTRDETAFADFARRVQIYAGVHDAAALTVPRPAVSAAPSEIRRATEARALVIRSARAGARQGDIFTPRIAAAFRRAIAAGCQDRYEDLRAAIAEDRECPLPAPAVHARWPIDAALPTMAPDLLAALPTLPAGLQYRFLNRDLVLLDIDANLIVDFIPDAIPSGTSASMP